MKFDILLVLFFVCFVVDNRAENGIILDGMKLELVQILLRHGERTCNPAEFYISNSNNLSLFEPYGLGQLTNNGKEQEYKIGLMLRQRYDGYLSRVYNPNDIYAYSSDHDRTKMSLQLVLAGLYPPAPEFVWNPNLQWQPLPIRYTPQKLDAILKPQESSKFKKLWHDAINSTVYRKKWSEYALFFDFLKEKLGRTINMKDKYADISNLYNALHIYEQLNLPLPDWYTNETKKSLRELFMLIVGAQSFTAKQKRINGGTLVRTFLENNSRKIYIYCGHDLNMVAFGLAHGIESEILRAPDFGTTVILEKLRGPGNQLYVRLLVWTPDTEKLIKLKLPNCEELCPIDQYLQITKDVIPSDEEMRSLMDDFDVTQFQNLYLRDTFKYSDN